MHTRSLAAVLALLTLACAGSSDSSAAFELADSAGVAIAYSRMDAGDTIGWGVTATPTVDIGVHEGDPAYQFFRISWVSRLPNGELAVVNAGSQEIRFYSADGTHTRSVGRAGDGPNEFRLPLGLMGRAQDSLTIWDLQTRRLTILSPEGEFVETTPVTERLLNPNALGVMSDGSLVLLDELFDIPEQGFAEIQMQVILHRPGSAMMDTLGQWPFWRIGSLGDLVGAPHFEPRGSAAAAPDLVWVGLAREAKVDAYDRSGTLVRSVRWSPPDLSVPPGAASVLLERQLADAPAERHAAIRRTHEAAPVAPQFPVYSRVMTGRDGLLRVQEYARPTDPDSTANRWLLFDATGELRGRLVFPRSFRPMEWAEGYVTGVFRDDLDVEIARVYELHWE